MRDLLEDVKIKLFIVGITALLMFFMWFGLVSASTLVEDQRAYIDASQNKNFTAAKLFTSRDLSDGAITLAENQSELLICIIHSTTRTECFSLKDARIIRDYLNQRLQ